MYLVPTCRPASATSIQADKLRLIVTGRTESIRDPWPDGGEPSVENVSGGVKLEWAGRNNDWDEMWEIAV